MFKLVVLFAAAALVAAEPGLVAPLAYSSVVPATSSVSQYSSSVVHGSPLYSAYAAPLAHTAYAAPLAHTAYATPYVAAPYHSAGVVLDAYRGVPLDTPAVAAAKAAHFQAKALHGYGIHALKKRSLVAPLAVAPVAAHVSPYSYAAPWAAGYSAPLVSAYSAPLVSGYSPLGYSAWGPRALNIHHY